jgi:hypothetical protein
MISAVSWLDFSERERRRALDVIEQFRDEDTRDELGVGTVRDALADLLFPGTSTVQTRARYFLFVPWTYLRLEERRVGYPEVERRDRQAEVRLIDVLLRTEDEGVIGKQSREKLQRLPSSIYWSGLRTWGILVFDRSQDEYHRWLNRYYQEIKRKSGEETDAEARRFRSANWHPNLTAPPDDFPDEASFTLRTEEAEYLEDRVQQRLRGTLLEHMVTNRVEVVDVGFPWHHPVAPSLPPQLKEILWHARHFSEIMLGAALLYNLMLAESRAEFGSLVDDYRSRIEGWLEDIEEIRRRISTSTLPALWTTVESSIGHRIPPRTRSFVTQWYGIALNAANAQTLTSVPSAARTLVRDRERQLKNVRARIGNDKMLVNWNGSSGAAQLNYRWKVASQIIDDIVSAL